MKVAITGSTGFIGNALTKQLEKTDSISLSTFDRSKYSLSSIDSLKNFVKDKDVIIHLAGATDTLDNCFKINILGTAHILEAISLFGKTNTRFIYASSFAVYEEQSQHNKLNEETSKTIPRNYYGMSKLLAEELIAFYSRMNNIKYTIFRIANPYGPNNWKKYSGIIPLLIDKIYKGEPIVINGSGSQSRDFIFINDLVQAFVKVLDYKDNSLLINICSGIEITIIELIKKIEAILRKKAILVFNKQQKEIGYWIGESEKARDKIGFLTTTDIDKGLQQIISSYLENKNL